ncbi:MAG TPA: type II toxin-antitoxin system prevent-host-death family antitoxin [Actinomycetota bacterium]
MERATVTEAKNRLSAYLDRVKSGETIVIVDRGRPVARLIPASSASEDASGRLARLERAGIVSPGRRAPHPSIAKTKPPKGRRGASALAALLDERGESR